MQVVSLSLTHFVPIVIVLEVLELSQNDRKIVE